MIKKLPEWFRRDVPTSPVYTKVKTLLDDLKLNTVCKEAKCPNVGECYSRGTATFMVLGDVCTRNCHFCAITLGKPRTVDSDEPRRLSEAVAKLGLKHVVITMVTRDDLKDGGSAHVVKVIEAIRQKTACTIEVLVSDFRGSKESVAAVVAAGPEVFNHNVETVPRLYKTVRPMMQYQRSLEVLSYARQCSPDILVKSGFMLGLGETADDVREVLKDLKAASCDVVTIGQYLKPPDSTLQVDRFVPPQEFEEWAMYARGLGFLWVEAGPLVRSSYRADEALSLMKQKTMKMLGKRIV